MSKSLQVSDDDGVTWYTLPGSTASIKRGAAPIEDTVFGQTFESTFPGLITWSVTGNSVYKGYAGYQATLKQAGTGTAVTGETMSLVSGKRYKIDDTAKQVWDRTSSIVVYDGGVDHTSDVASFNYLHGEVVFKSSYTVTGAVTIDVTYLPLVTLGKAQSYTLNQSAAFINTTDFNVASGNGGYATGEPGLRNADLELSGFWTSSSSLASALEARSELIVEINPDGAGKSVARGFYRVNDDSQSGDVGALEEESTKFGLNVPNPDALAELPFQWAHSNDSPIPTGVKICLTAWENATTIKVRYLEDGATGTEGEAVVTETSMSGALDSATSFALSLTGSGAPSSV